MFVTRCKVWATAALAVGVSASRVSAEEPAGAKPPPAIIIKIGDDKPRNENPQPPKVGAQLDPPPKGERKPVASNPNPNPPLPPGRFGLELRPPNPNPNSSPGGNPPQPVGADTVTFSPDGKVLVVKTGDKIRAYDTATGKLLWETASPQLPATGGGGDLRFTVRPPSGSTAPGMPGMPGMPGAPSGPQLPPRAGAPNPWTGPGNPPPGAGTPVKPQQPQLEVRGTWMAAPGNPSQLGGTQPPRGDDTMAALTKLLKSEDPEIRSLAEDLVKRMKALEARQQSEMLKKLQMLERELAKKVVEPYRPDATPPLKPQGLTVEQRLDRLTAELEELRKEIRKK